MEMETYMKVDGWIIREKVGIKLESYAFILEVAGRPTKNLRKSIG